MLPLKKTRLASGFSLTQLTVLTGISTADLSRMENGRIHPYPGWRRRLAKAFGVPERELFPKEVEEACRRIAVEEFGVSEKEVEDE